MLMIVQSDLLVHPQSQTAVTAILYILHTLEMMPEACCISTRTGTAARFLPAHDVNLNTSIARQELDTLPTTEVQNVVAWRPSTCPQLVKKSSYHERLPLTATLPLLLIISNIAIKSLSQSH